MIMCNISMCFCQSVCQMVFVAVLSNCGLVSITSHALVCMDVCNMHIAACKHAYCMGVCITLYG